ncbi:MAG: BtrH N-terminal domain-containing protein [Bacteroidota bacterium]|nr:BtrH N-terminal domain-containing protein [Bacteroidota bacterium]
MNTIPYAHKMAAHCESGAVTSLLNNAGLDITEPMVFGISSGIFFGYFHKMKSFTFPTIILRSQPGQMRKAVSKRLGIRFHTERFRDPEYGMKRLDELLAENKPVGVQVDFYYMDYIPEWERVHINVHYIVVVGKNESGYIISDSYFPNLGVLKESSLKKARFAGGNMAPKGFLFYPEYIPEKIDYNKAIVKGIRKACFNMLKIPIPFLGVKGIRQFAKRLPEWPKLARDTEHLSHEIMKINILLEDQGTGGGGFRFIFATFLQQAAEILKRPELADFSKEMMRIGDGWREISLFSARIGKNRDLGPERLQELSKMLYDRADNEEKFFKKLYKSV